MARVFIALFVASFALSACAPRPNISLVPEASQIGAKVPVFVGTTRTKATDTFFRHGRSERLQFARVDVSIPPAHEVGKLEMPKGPVDPARHFVASDFALFEGGGDFRRAVAREMARRAPKDREAVIYVHGFNNTFADGVFRSAQTAHDFQLPGVIIHYSWPSRGHPLGYAYDRDSALFARDGLAQLIRTVNQTGAQRITIVGHSMGSQLLMEALRQMALAAPGSVHQVVDTVILIAPDIDVDVFRSQARAIGRLPRDFVIFASERDRALLLSARASGQRNRLGNADSVDQVADLDVLFVDVTAFSGSDPLNHLTLVASPTLILLIRNIAALKASFDADAAGRAGLFPGTVLTVQNATEIILAPTAGP